MSNLPDSSYFTDGDRTKAEMKASFEDWIESCKLMLGMKAPCEILCLKGVTAIEIGVTPNQGGVDPDPPSCIIDLGTNDTGEVKSIDSSALPDNTLVLFRYSANSPMPASGVVLTDDEATALRPRLKGQAGTKTFLLSASYKESILFYKNGDDLSEIMRDNGSRIVSQPLAQIGMIAGDSTPSVLGAGSLATLDDGTTPCAITMFDDGIKGQRLTVISTGDYVTATDGGNLKLSGNWTPGAGDTLTLIFNGADWYEIGRSAN